MIAADLSFNRRVVWRGREAIICEIRPGKRGTAVQICVAGGYRHWTTPAELEWSAS